MNLNNPGRVRKKKVSEESVASVVYEKIFPSSKLADKPKPWRISLPLEVVYGGWTFIRHSVISKFWRFKDAEFGTLFNLLDNYIPLVLSIYSISFKLNHFSEYFRAMIRIWIMFTCFKQRHYNKVPLLWINMYAHWGKHSTNLYQLLRNYIVIFDEYPVENTHSILRAQSKPSDTAEQLRKKQQANFRSHFTSPSQFSFSQNQLQFLKVKCAQILCSMFTLSSPGQSSFFSSRNTGMLHVTHVKFPYICQNNPVKMSVSPLGYHTQVRTDQTKQCDLPDCENSNPNEDRILLTGCFHSFYKMLFHAHYARTS